MSNKLKQKFIIILQPKTAQGQPFSPGICGENLRRIQGLTYSERPVSIGASWQRDNSHGVHTNANATKKTYMNAMPVTPTAGWPLCNAVHTMITATEIVMPKLDNIKSLRRPNRSMKKRPESVDIIITGV